MRRRYESFGTLTLAACLLVAPAIALAQQPWTVTVTPTLNPLPIGLCAAIQLTVLDASGKDVPRNPRGDRVTIADFDIAVTTGEGTSVAAHQTDAYHWSACACQGAAAGTRATVIATYPARALAAQARVPGVAFQRTAIFALAAPKGAINPPACVRASAAPAPALVVPPAVALPPVAPPVTTTPAPAPAPGTGILTGEALLGSTAVRERRYVPGPVTVSFPLSAHGSWYEPGPMTVTFGLSAQGSWYEPGPVTVTFDLSATGSWLERTQSPTRPLQPAPLKP